MPDALQHSGKISDALQHSEKTSSTWQHSAKDVLVCVHALQHCHGKSATVSFLLSPFFVAFVFFCLAARLATCSGSMLRKRSFRFMVGGLSACSAAQLNYTDRLRQPWHVLVA